MKDQHARSDMAAQQTHRRQFRGLRSIFRNGTGLAVMNIATVLVRLFVVALIARSLGPQLYGQYAYVLGLVLVGLGMAMFGTNGIVIRNIGRADAGENLNVSVALRLLTAGAASLGVFGAAALAVTDGTLLALAAALSAGLFMRAISELFQSMLIGQERGAFAAGLGTARLVIELVFVAGAAAFNAPIWAFGAIYALIWTGQAAAWGIAVGPAMRLPRWDRARLMALAREGAPLGLTSSASLFLVQSPVVLSSRSDGGTIELGLLALAVQIIAMSRLVPGAFTSAALPILARSTQRRDGKNDLFHRVQLLLTWAVFGTACLIGAPVAQAALPLVFGTQFDGAITLIAPAMLIALGWTLLMAFETMALIASRAGAFCVISCAAAALIILLDSGLASTGVDPLLLAGCGVWSATLAALVFARATGQASPQLVAEQGAAAIALGTAFTAGLSGAPIALATTLFVLVIAGLLARLRGVLNALPQTGASVSP